MPSAESTGEGLEEKKRRMLLTIDLSLEVLGRVASTALRLSFKKVQKVGWESIVDDPEPLERHIKAVFSNGSVVLIDIINKNVCNEFGLPYTEGRGLVDCLKEALAAGK
jgi:hypothetical protein